MELRDPTTSQNWSTRWRARYDRLSVCCSSPRQWQVGAPMRHSVTQRPALIWSIAAIAAASAAATLTMLVLGSGNRGTIEALRITGRLSFFLFWFAYAGGMLARLHV